MNRPFQPFMTPEDLGIDLEEDSPDLTEEETALAVETKSQDDFVEQAKAFIVSGTGTVRFEQRRRAGILYCRVNVGSQHRLFQVEWLRSSP